MDKYKTKTRTTLNKTDDLPHAGVYILAYMGKVVYVGKAETSVTHRLEQHWFNRGAEALGAWMDKLRDDWCNIRLDVLEPPDNVDERGWLKATESALVRQFKPLFNSYLQA